MRKTFNWQDFMKWYRPRLHLYKEERVLHAGTTCDAMYDYLREKNL